MNTDKLEAPVGWVESLTRSKAQIAAGESVPLQPVIDRIMTAAKFSEPAFGAVWDNADDAVYDGA